LQTQGGDFDFLSPNDSHPFSIPRLSFHRSFNAGNIVTGHCRLLKFPHGFSAIVEVKVPALSQKTRLGRGTRLDAHRELDDAVLAAYGWPKNLSDQDILTRLLQLNMERSRPPI
jgi:hypothetical protein